MQRAEQRAASAGDRRAADDHRRDRLQLEPEPGVARHRLKRTALSTAASADERARQREHTEDDARRLDAGEPRRLRVRADGVERAARRAGCAAPTPNATSTASATSDDERTAPAPGASPNHWKFAGRSCTHAPSVAQRSASRHATSIASVTMIDGKPSVPTSSPFSAPIAAPTTSTAQRHERRSARPPSRARRRRRCRPRTASPPRCRSRRRG